MFEGNKLAFWLLLRSRVRNGILCERFVWDKKVHGGIWIKASKRMGYFCISPRHFRYPLIVPAVQHNSSHYNHIHHDLCLSILLEAWSRGTTSIHLTLLALFKSTNLRRHKHGAISSETCGNPQGMNEMLEERPWNFLLRVTGNSYCTLWHGGHSRETNSLLGCKVMVLRVSDSWSVIYLAYRMSRD